MFSTPSHIRWFWWSDCKLNENMINPIKHFVEDNVKTKRIKLAFSYNIINHVGYDNIKYLSILLSDIQHIQVCGSFIHSKGVHLLNIAFTVDCHYNSPQELAADYLAAVLCHATQSTAPYLESLPAEYATVIENSLQSALTISVLDISYNSVNSQFATQILPFASNLQEFHASNNDWSTETIIKIFKSLQKSTTLTVFNVSNNSINEEAADDFAAVLSHNTRLQEIHLQNNSFKTKGIIKIVKALQEISTLTVLSISNNDIGEETADDIATVLSYNAKLQELYLHSNDFKTAGMVKIAKALECISTLTVLSISNNRISEEAADDIAAVLSHNIKLQKLYLGTNSFKTLGMIKIAKALQNVSTLVAFNISNNNVGEEQQMTLLLCYLIALNFRSYALITIVLRQLALSK